MEPAMLALLAYLDGESPSAPLRVPGVPFDTSVTAEWIDVNIIRLSGTPARSGQRWERVVVVADIIVRNSNQFARAYELADEIAGDLKATLIIYSDGGVNNMSIRLYEPERDGTPAPEDAGEDAIAVRVTCEGTLESVV